MTVPGSEQAPGRQQEEARKGLRGHKRKEGAQLVPGVQWPGMPAPQPPNGAARL